MKPNVVTIENLSFSFSDSSSFFLKNISASFSSEKLNFIKGANGSGKSTFLRIISGKLYPKESVSGSFKFEHNFAVNLASNLFLPLKEHVGLLPQKYDSILSDIFTGSENLSFCQLKRYPDFSSLVTEHTLDNFIEMFEIPLNKPLYLLSGGQRQIIGMSMMLQKKKTILIMDEPTAALDEKNSKLVFDFLEKVRTTYNSIIIVVSHDREILENYAGSSYYELLHGTFSKKERCEK